MSTLTVCDAENPLTLLTDAELAERLRQYEARFATWAGIDLKTMATAYDPAHFRAYLDLAREWRRRKRTLQTTAAVSA